MTNVLKSEHGKFNELISVIVPIYKVEKYLETCVLSILNQTYPEIEIILVDDGSPDNCPKICDELAKKSKKIKVIHKKNGGLSEARNCGIKNANGKYYFFLDSDDYIESSTIQKLYTAILENDADVAVAGYTCFDDETNEYLYTKVSSRKVLLNGVEKYYYMFSGEESMLLTVPWNKLYKKTIFDEEIFPVGKYHEDEYAAHKICEKSNIICILPEALYLYRKRKGSIMANEPLDRKIDAIDALHSRAEFFVKSELYELFGINMIVLINYIGRNFANVDNMSFVEKVNCKISEIKNLWMDNRKYVKNIKRRLLVDLFFKNINLYPDYIRKKLHI